jgi:hypothetical protein
MVDQKQSLEIIILLYEFIHTELQASQHQQMLTSYSCSLYTWSYSCAIITRLSPLNFSPNVRHCFLSSSFSSFSRLLRSASFLWLWILISLRVLSLYPVSHNKWTYPHLLALFDDHSCNVF